MSLRRTFPGECDSGYVDASALRVMGVFSLNWGLRWRRRLGYAWRRARIPAGYATSVIETSLRCRFRLTRFFAASRRASRSETERADFFADFTRCLLRPCGLSRQAHVSERSRPCAERHLKNPCYKDRHDDILRQHCKAFRTGIARSLRVPRRARPLYDGRASRRDRRDRRAKALGEACLLLHVQLLYGALPHVGAGYCQATLGCAHGTSLSGRPGPRRTRRAASQRDPSPGEASDD